MSWCGCFHPLWQCRNTTSAWEHVTQFSIKTKLWVATACLLCTEACLAFFFVTPPPHKFNPQKCAVNQTVLHLNAASPFISDSPSPSVVGLCRWIKDVFFFFSSDEQTFVKIHSLPVSPDKYVLKKMDLSSCVWWFRGSSMRHTAHYWKSETAWWVQPPPFSSCSPL